MTDEKMTYTGKDGKTYVASESLDKALSDTKEAVERNTRWTKRVVILVAIAILIGVYIGWRIDDNNLWGQLLDALAVCRIQSCVGTAVEKCIPA